jgi:histidine triad (HIT) family protein
VIRTHRDIEDSDVELLGKLHLAAKKVAQAEGLSSYRLIINCDEGAGQTVPHLHLHVIGGRPCGWPPG